MNIIVLNKYKISEDLDDFFEFVQSIVDIGNMIQDFVLLCSEESNLNVGWLVHTVLLDCDKHPSLLVCCYVIHRMTVCKFVLHAAPWLSLCQYGVPTQERVSGFQHCELQYSVLLISFILLFHQDRLAETFRLLPIHFSLAIGNKVQSNFFRCRVFGTKKISHFFFDF